MKRRIFDTPFAIFEEKNFSSLRRDNKYFLRNKRSEMEETAQYFEKQFFFIRSEIFIALSKSYAAHRNYAILSKSLVARVDCLIYCLLARLLARSQYLAVSV
jgi:hypothetical protein